MLKPKKMKTTVIPSPKLYSQNEFSHSNAHLGDIITYRFTHPVNTDDTAICSYINPSKSSILPHDVNDIDILNQFIISELLSKYALSKVTAMDNSKIQLKAIKETLNRIKRYNNKRKYEERLGFASTLTAQAEEIGISNSVKFLLQTIHKYLVYLCAKIGK